MHKNPKVLTTERCLPHCFQTLKFAIALSSKPKQLNLNVRTETVFFQTICYKNCHKNNYFSYHNLNSKIGYIVLSKTNIIHLSKTAASKAAETLTSKKI